MATVQKIIDLKQPAIIKGILSLKPDECFEICQVPAGGTVNFQDGKLIVTYDDGEEMSVTIEIGENNG